MLSSVTLLYEISLAKRPMFCWAASILLLICLSIFQIPMVFVIILSFDLKSFQLSACRAKTLFCLLTFILAVRGANHDSVRLLCLDPITLY